MLSYRFSYLLILWYKFKTILCIFGRASYLVVKKTKHHMRYCCCANFMDVSKTCVAFHNHCLHRRILSKLPNTNPMLFGHFPLFHLLLRPRTSWNLFPNQPSAVASWQAADSAWDTKNFFENAGRWEPMRTEKFWEVGNWGSSAPASSLEMPVPTFVPSPTMTPEDTNSLWSWQWMDSHSSWKTIDKIVKSTSHFWQLSLHRTRVWVRLFWVWFLVVVFQISAGVSFYFNSEVVKLKSWYCCLNWWQRCFHHQFDIFIFLQEIQNHGDCPGHKSSRGAATASALVRHPAKGRAGAGSVVLVDFVFQPFRIFQP